MIFNLAATFISAALLVHGQAAPNTSSISPCILNCTTVSLPAGSCTSVTQLSCICTSVPFQTAAGACIAADCPSEAPAAIALQNATCGPYLAGLNSTSSSSSSSSSSSGSGSASSSHSTTGTGTAAPGSTSTTHPSTTTTSSSGGFHTAGIASGVALALFGAAFSLF